MPKARAHGKRIVLTMHGGQVTKQSAGYSASRVRSSDRGMCARNNWLLTFVMLQVSAAHVRGRRQLHSQHGARQSFHMQEPVLHLFEPLCEQHPGALQIINSQQRRALHSCELLHV